MGALALSCLGLRVARCHLDWGSCVCVVYLIGLRPFRRPPPQTNEYYVSQFVLGWSGFANYTALRSQAPAKSSEINTEEKVHRRGKKRTEETSREENRRDEKRRETVD